MRNYACLLAIVVMVSMVSCDAIKDATTVEIETDLNIDIPVATTIKSGSILKSANAEMAVFQFGGNGTFSMADNNDISDYISNINDILLNGVSKIQIINVPTGGKISKFKLNYGINPDAGTTGVNITTELTAINGIIEITDVAWINQLLTLVKQNKKSSYKFVVSGDASYDIQSTLKIKIPVIIEASPLK